ncbi:PREDICTED: sister chromatid cohesion 1 protein 1 isoform X2 [Tarenaya hassleriana]|uniref:sister chromatid cohesion 1 protein 1 isoform X2 n=1 Tax=Tarenaya hassleriana TaxID=28532 RepID=UPI00053C74EA|nr:PREDICTED: sister chromatid cohesion 1 protein 1 isoform X2 [Tarenaya hassleriana]
MFYSHQLLARKAPLGQIWMAATLHAKINRKKLSKLNIINICEEILNPSVPMALRLSGILMGGVVIVYERKVKLLYEDVNRLLVEINSAWRVKAAPDPTLLPKGKTHARKEAVTLPENKEADFEDIEQTRNDSHVPNVMDFHQTTYFSMRLDDLEEPNMNHNPGQEDLGQHLHQADPENITLFECHGSYQANTDTYDRFERFDIEGDDETQMNFNSREGTNIPSTLIPSPPHRHHTPRGDKATSPQMFAEQPLEHQKPGREERDRQCPLKRKARRTAASMMDYEQTIISGHIYQSWLQDASDIISRGQKKRKAQRTITSGKKVTKLMDIPPTLLIDHLRSKGHDDISYPPPLHQLWSKSTHLVQNPTSEIHGPGFAHEQSTGSPQERMNDHNQTDHNLDNGMNSHNNGRPAEKFRTNITMEDISIEDLMAGGQANLVHNDHTTETNVMITPGYSGDDVRSMPSSASWHAAVSSNAEINSKSSRSNKGKPQSSSGKRNIGLEPVAEDRSWRHADFPDFVFELSTFPEKGFTPDRVFQEQSLQ